MDRLTTLIDRFSLTVRAEAPEQANLSVETGADGKMCRIVFLPRDVGFAGGKVSGFSAQVGFGGAANPLLASLPDRVEVVLKDEPEVGHLVALMQSESAAERCGAASVLNRLGEVLFVRLLRHLIETGQTRPGVLGGLSDPRISRALVAMHDRPEQSWSPADLAEVAGLSRSRFSEVFQQVVGETPAAYLRRWRLVLARQDLEKGARVEGIAHRYGFASSDSFARAFRRWFGETPLAVRQAAAREV